MGIRTKLIILSLILAGVPCAVLAIYSRSSLQGFSHGALSAGSALGTSILDDNRRGMEELARANLLSAAVGRAKALDAHIRRVQTELALVGAGYAQALAQSGTAPDNGYLCTDKPAREKDHAIFFLPEGVTDPDGHIRATMAQGAVYLQAVLADDTNIEAFGICSPEGAFALAPWMAMPQAFDPRKRDWHAAALAAGGEAVWTLPYVSAASHRLIVTCTRMVRAPKGMAPAAVLADVNIQTLTSRILELDFGNASAIVLDRTGCIIAQNGMMSDSAWNEKPAATNLLTTGTDTERLLAKAMIAGESGVARGALLNEPDAFVAYAPVGSTGWSVGTLMAVKDALSGVLASSAEIERKTAEFREGGARYTSVFLYWFMVVVIACAIGIVLTCVLVARRVTRPIATLADGARRIGGGDFSHRLDIRTGDEIEELATAFNGMAASLREYMDNLARTVAAKERIEQELAVAAQIQISMLPREFPPFPGRTDIDLHATMKPAREVGGDFYDYFFIDSRTLWFCIGDVCGKGVPAALFMAITKTLLASGATQLKSPAAILQAVNNLLARNNENCMFATVFCGFLDTETGVIRYANGAHNHPVILPASGEAQYHVPAVSGIPLGPMDLTEPTYADETLELPHGATLLLYTDGVTEAFDPDGVALGEERFLAILQKRVEAAHPLVDQVTAGVQVFVREAEPSDDITILAIRRT